MPKIPGVNHLAAVRALEKAGFRIVRQGKHNVMSDGIRILTIPRYNPVNAFTMLFSYHGCWLLHPLKAVVLRGWPFPKRSIAGEENRHTLLSRLTR